MADNKASIYSLLVKDKNDFLGLFAYSVYRQQKDGLRLEASGPDDPTTAAERIAAFERLSRTETQLRHYQEQALMLAASFTDSLLSEEIEAIQRRLKAEYHAKLEATRPSFWSGVWASVVASFVFTVLLGLLVFFTWSLKQGFKPVIENVFDLKIVPADDRSNPKGQSQ